MSLEGLRVLVVDDEAAIVELVEKALVMHGCVVHTADGGADALEILLREDLDLVLCDLRMPQVDGLQVGVAARRRGILVMFMSGLVGAQDAEGIRAMGAPLLPKPFRVQVLIKALETLLADADLGD